MEAGTTRLAQVDARHPAQDHVPLARSLPRAREDARNIQRPQRFVLRSLQANSSPSFHDTAPSKNVFATWQVELSNTHNANQERNFASHHRKRAPFLHTHLQRTNALWKSCHMVHSLGYAQSTSRRDLSKQTGKSWGRLVQRWKGVGVYAQDKDTQTAPSTFCVQPPNMVTGDTHLLVVWQETNRCMASLESLDVQKIDV